MTETPDEGADFESVDWTQLDDLGGEEHPALPPGVQATVLSDDMLARRLLWDIAPCSHAVAVANLLGLPPASEEVDDMEHRESHLRLVNAASVVPFVEVMARHATAAAVGSMIVGHDDTVSEEDRNEAIEKMDAVVFQSAYSIIAELVDMGMLHFPHFAFHTVVDTTEEEEE